EVVQQFGMRWQHPGVAEVAGGLHERTTEEQAPNPVDHDARRQWIAATRNRLGEFPAAAAIFERLRLAFGRKGKETSLHDRSLTLDVSADEHVEVLSVAVFNDMEGVGRHFVGTD